MRSFFSSNIIVSALAVCLLAAGCASTTQGTHSADEAQPTLILIGIDGFRWDFLDRGATPTLSKLAASGVRAERLIPSFPTKTFPNHYTIVTGLRPSEHGLVANNVWDEEIGIKFELGNRDAVTDGRWYGGEPIWVTAEKQGLVTAPMFWPGAEAEIQGIRPAHSIKFEHSMSPEARVDWVLERLDLPASERPRFLTIYFNTVDDAAHRLGPEPSEGLNRALGLVDRTIAYLVAGLKDRGMQATTDLLIVSDHGMSATSSERVILIDQYIDVESANVIDWNPVLALWPDDEHREEILEALEGAHPNLAVYRGDRVPPEYEFADHSRIAPIIGIANDGWTITTTAQFKGCPTCIAGGSHGYDHRASSMGALLIAHGPSFVPGARLPAVSNLDLYPLMARILGVPAAPNSGNPATFESVFRDPL